MTHLKMELYSILGQLNATFQIAQAISGNAVIKTFESVRALQVAVVNLCFQLPNTCAIAVTKAFMTSIRKAREAELIKRGQNLEPLRLNRSDET